MKKLKLLALLLIVLTFPLIPVIFSGCSQILADTGIKISGAWDLYYLSLALNNNTAEDASAPPVSMSPSLNSIDELKNGKCDAVLLGREPTAEDVQGLKCYVIAYDAVCMIIDENSYQGGTYSVGGQRKHKNGGLTGLSSENVTELLTSDPAKGWYWNGDNYIANPSLDYGSWLSSVDSVFWVKTPALINFDFFFTPGKYDTQSVLYDDLGLNEKAMLSGRKLFGDSQQNMEEEILAWEYKDSFLFATKYGPQDYAYKIGFASRRVMTIASQHVPLRVLSIDGINPLASPQSVYDGSYKFSRKICLLVRNNSPASVTKLVDYLLSVQGQKLISDVGYLPVLNTN